MHPHLSNLRAFLLKGLLSSSICKEAPDPVESLVPIRHDPIHGILARIFEGSLSGYQRCLSLDACHFKNRQAWIGQQMHPAKEGLHLLFKLKGSVIPTEACLL